MRKPCLCTQITPLYITLIISPSVSSNIADVDIDNIGIGDTSIVDVIGSKIIVDIIVSNITETVGSIIDVDITSSVIKKVDVNDESVEDTSIAVVMG